MNGLTEFKRREKGIDRIESLEIVFIKSTYIYYWLMQFVMENILARIQRGELKLTRQG